MRVSRFTCGGLASGCELLIYLLLQGLQEASDGSFLLAGRQVLRAKQLPGGFKSIQPVIRGAALQLRCLLHLHTCTGTFIRFYANSPG